MRTSRSGSTRGLRSAGSPHTQESSPSSSRTLRASAPGPVPQARAKRRGRALPLNKNRKDSNKEVDIEQPPKGGEKDPNEDENIESKETEKTAELEEPSEVTEDVEPHQDPEPQEDFPQELNDRLQANRDGKLIIMSVTVHGAIIDKNYDITTGVGQDGNQFFCEICKGFGNVVCCDGCPKVYHAACISTEDPARVALDNDDDPWFCTTCRERGVSTKLESRKGSNARSLPPRAAASPATIKATIKPDATTSRPERRTVKRKCNECQKSGGEMTPCEGCGVYLHNPPCKTDDDSNEGMAQICSNCRVEAVVEQEEEDREMEEEETSASPAPRPSPDDKAGRQLRKRSIGDEDHDQEEDLSSEEISQGDEEEEEEEDDGEDVLEVDVDNEESPDKKKRKRSNSVADSQSSKKKKIPGEKRKRKKGDKKKKKKKKKRKIQEEEDGNEPPGKKDQFSAPRRSFTSRGLVQATPAFFFFLNDSKMRIERVLARKHRYFNRLPKGLERNEIIAREGAHWWVKLRTTEQKRYFTMSMRDFEEKVIEWKEEKTIREMIAARDPEDRFIDGVLDDEDGQDLTPEDEMMVYKRHQRLYLSTSVGSKPFTPEAGKSNNRILLELLQDMRFHPLSMFNPLRADGEFGLMDRSKVAIPHFEIQGPIATSVGDECSGCARGWNHFCPVIRRRLPAVETRARLQPPMSSLMATRVGLGLKAKIPQVQQDTNGKDVELFEPRLSNQAAQAKRVPVIPSFTLTKPMTRADDVVCFVEECLAMKVPEPPRPAPPSVRAEIKKKSILSRGALPMRGRRKSNESFDGASSLDTSNDSSKSVLNKCGRCRTIIDNDTGCIQCRRAQLVINTSKRTGPANGGPLLLTGKEKKKDAVKVQTTMIGRLTVKENNFENQAEGDRAVANAIIKLRWAPSAILPPQKLYAPTPSQKMTTSDDDEEGVESNNDEKPMDEVNETHAEVNSDVDMKPEAVACNDKSSDVPKENGAMLGSKQPAKETTNEQGAEPGARPSRLRPRSARSLGSSTVASDTQEDMDIDTMPDRQEMAKKHKDEATELQKRSLNVACCGIFLAMVRRDPLCLFAEPVPSNVVGYSQVVISPIDFSKIKSRVQREKYSTLGSFVTDARLLCTNALAFNPPGSIYSKTAKELHDVIDVMQKRASGWMHTIKDAHASSYARRGIYDTMDGEDDPFKELRKTWPEAVEMLENGGWLREQVASDFMRTKENESAYYGSIAVRRAATAAAASLAPYTDSGGAHSAVIRRSHTEDESLRHAINSKVAAMTSPIQLKDIPRWREESVMRTLRRVQNRRVESCIMSENGCARCDGIRTEAKLALNAVRWGRNKRKGEVETLPRVDDSRLSLTTGLASMNARARIGTEFDGSEVTVKTDKLEENVDDDEKGESDEAEASATTESDDKVEIEPAKTKTEPTRDETESARAATPVQPTETEQDKWDKVSDVAVNVQGSRIHGWGLFADQPFKKGDLVAEYVGEFIVNAVADAREKMYQERRIQDYQFRVDEHLVIDATLKGGHGRYINHNCNPNCIAKIIDGNPPNKHLKRVMIIAQRDIKAREEITYDYQFPLELDLEARIPCNCGSLLCRGFMNWDLPEKGSKNRVLRTQKRGGNMRDRIRRLGRPLKKQEPE